VDDPKTCTEFSTFRDSRWVRLNKGQIALIRGQWIGRRRYLDERNLEMSLSVPGTGMEPGGPLRVCRCQNLGGRMHTSPRTDMVDPPSSLGRWSLTSLHMSFENHASVVPMEKIWRAGDAW